MESEKIVNVIGAGLAGVEAAYQLAKNNIKVKLYEMRPIKMTPAHHTSSFAELVCSNKFLVEGSKITSKEIFSAQKSVLFGNSLEYRKITENKTEVGYDLYIKTSTQTSELD